MLLPLAHRGPDDCGMTFFRSHPSASGPSAPRLALGHRRLAILDLSSRGHQPMSTPDRSLTLTFNGEIYNYRELRRLLAPYAAFQTETDTEVLLHAYRHWGLAMLHRLDGMFAFALWDARAQRLLCARDPLGIKPFYYAHDAHRFLFASEPGAVLAGLGSPGHLDAPHLAEFLVLGVSDHDEGTCFQEVRQLRGGHWLAVAADGRVTGPYAYWQPPTEERDEGESVPGRVREAIVGAVRRQLRADVPVGSCLSGGLDSGTIVAAAAEVLGEEAREFRTLTLGEQGFAGDETELARGMAERAGVRWEKVEAGEGKLCGDLERVIGVMGEPFGGLSVLGQYEVMRQARERGLKVMLDGQGGDEVFLGYRRAVVRVMGEYLREGRVASAVREWRALSRNAALPLATSLLGNLFFTSPGLVRWYNSRPLSGLVQPSLLEQVRPEVAQALFNSHGIQALQSGELTRYPLPAYLRYEDRNSMAFGLEARVPMLAVGLVETVLPLPWRWKVRNGWTKYALRAAMTDRLPAEVVWQRRKRGFEVPQRRWVERARPQITAWLADLAPGGPINVPELLAQVDRGHSGRQWLWRCLSVALWMRFSGVR
jgi:asparagine synthase (glutamine-hydrolysing)